VVDVPVRDCELLLFTVEALLRVVDSGAFALVVVRLLLVAVLVVVRLLLVAVPVVVRVALLPLLDVAERV